MAKQWQFPLNLLSSLKNKNKNGANENEFIEKGKEKVFHWYGTLMLSLEYVLTDMMRNKRAFVIGATTIFLVVAFDLVLQSTVSRANILFIKLAENSIGEFDLLLTPTSISLSSTSATSPSPSSSSSSDSSLAPPSGTGSDIATFLLNGTEIRQKLQNNPLVAGVVPRWYGFGQVSVIPPYQPIKSVYSTTSSTNNGNDTNNNSSSSSPSSPQSPPALAATIVSFDTVAEKDIGLGRQWNHRQLGLGECHCSASLLRSLGLRPNVGDSLRISIDLSQLLTNLGLLSNVNNALNISNFIITNNTVSVVDLQLLLEQLQSALNISVGGGGNNTIGNVLNTSSPSYALLADAFSKLSTLTYDLNIIDAVPYPYGKWPSVLGDVVVIESKYLIDTLAASILSYVDAFQQTLDIFTGLGLIPPTDAIAVIGFDVNQLYQIDINEYSLTMLVKYSKRYEAYQKPGAQLTADVVQFTNSVSDDLGITYAASFSTPLAMALANTYIISLFLDQIFRAAVAILLILGILLIYSLMLSDVEEKTYEYGMLRSLGMRSAVLIQVIITQALYFAIPGLLVGTMVGFLGYLPFAQSIAEYSYTNVVLDLDKDAVITSVCVALIAPIFSNILPIRRALSKTLRDSLDRYHQLTNEVSITVERLQDVGISPSLTVLGLFLVIVGVMVYYLMPYSFIFNNLEMFLSLLMAILMSMVFGLIIVAQTLQPFLEHRMLSLILWGSDKRKMENVIRKNMSGHANRNHKMALMFAIAVAFIIFSSSIFSLQSSAIIDNILLFVGADIVVHSWYNTHPLDYSRMSAWLDERKKNPAFGLEDYAFTTFALYEVDTISETMTSSLSQVNTIPITVYAVSENYLDVVFSQYLILSQKDDSYHYSTTKTGEADVIKSMYRHPSTVSNNKFHKNAEKRHVNPPPIPNSYTVQTLYTTMQSSSSSSSPNATTARSAYYEFSNNNTGNNNNTDYNGGGDYYYYNNNENESEKLMEAALNTTIRVKNNWGPYPSQEDAYNNYIDIVVSTALNGFSSVSLHQPMKFTVNLNSPSSASSQLSYMAMPRAFATKFPGFFLSGYSVTAYYSAAFITFDTYQKILNDVEFKSKPPSTSSTSSTEFRPVNISQAYSRCYIKMKKGVSMTKIQDTINGLRLFINTQYVRISNVNRTVQLAKVATDMLLLFCNVVAMISLLLCFFILWLSLTANMRENSWELGVLRALGLTFNQVLRAYIYEACAVILSALLLGTIIGLTVSITLTLQFDLFTELPFKFVFPTTQFMLVIIMTIFSIAAGTILPSRSLQQRPISHILKGL